MRIPKPRTVFLSLLLFIFALIAFGCSTSRIVKKGADGSEVTAWNSRLIWSTEGFELSYTSNSTTIRIQKSNPDAQAMGAIAEGAARGAK